MLSRKPRILYVEDHEDTRELIRTVLGSKYELIDVPGITGAVEALSKHDFDLLILDSWLPDGSGLDFCKTFHRSHPDTPVVFYSAAAYETDRAAALAAGACEYVVKPTPPAKLCEAVESVLAMHPVYLRADATPSVTNSIGLQQN